MAFVSSIISSFFRHNFAAMVKIKAAPGTFGGYNPEDFGLNSLPVDLHLKTLPKPDPNLEIFYMSNERYQALTIANLSSLPYLENGAHIGFSTLFNFDIIVCRDSKIAFLCDISEKVFKYFKIIQDAILEARNREEFVDIILEKLNRSDLLKAESKMKDTFAKIVMHFTNELERPGSWLSTDKGFNKIKSMYEHKMIFHICLDASDQEGNLKSLSDWLKSKGYEPDTLYLSNIFEVLSFVDKKEAFIKNFENFINENLIVIDSKMTSRDLIQRFYRGSLPDYQI